MQIRRLAGAYRKQTCKHALKHIGSQLTKVK